MNYLVMSFVWAFGTASFVAADQARADIFDGETTAKMLNVRTGPGTSHRVKTIVPDGTPVAIFEVKNGWARIAADTGSKLVSGWVSGKYLQAYEVALPQVASGGFDDATEGELDALSQVVMQTLEEAKLGKAFPEVDVVSTEVPKSLPATQTTERRTQIIVRLDDTVDIVVLEPMSSAKLTSITPLSLIEDAQSAEPETWGEASPKIADKLLSYQAMNMACRSSYFSGVLDACKSDINIEVSLPEAFANLIDDKLNLQCEVDYIFDADGSKQTETTRDYVQVPLNNGKGSAILESRINFLYRRDNVTRVQVDEVTCGAAAAN